MLRATSQKVLLRSGMLGWRLTFGPASGHALGVRGSGPSGLNVRGVRVSACAMWFKCLSALDQQQHHHLHHHHDHCFLPKLMVGTPISCNSYSKALGIPLQGTPNFGKAPYCNSFACGVTKRSSSAANLIIAR